MAPYPTHVADDDPPRGNALDRMRAPRRAHPARTWRSATRGHRHARMERSCSSSCAGPSRDHDARSGWHRRPPSRIPDARCRASLPRLARERAAWRRSSGHCPSRSHRRGHGIPRRVGCTHRCGRILLDRPDLSSRAELARRPRLWPPSAPLTPLGPNRSRPAFTPARTTGCTRPPPSCSRRHIPLPPTARRCRTSPPRSPDDRGMSRPKRPPPALPRSTFPLRACRP